MPLFLCVNIYVNYEYWRRYIYVFPYIYICIHIWYIYGRGFRSHSGQLSKATSKNASVMNTIYIYVYIYNIYICIYIYIYIIYNIHIYIYTYIYIYIMYWIIAYKKHSCTLLWVSGKCHLQKYYLFTKMKNRIQIC